MGTTSYQRGLADRLNVTKVVLHQDFSNSPTLLHDIALFKLGSELSYPRVCMDDSPSTTSELCYVAGWGSVDGKGMETKLRMDGLWCLTDSDVVTKRSYFLSSI